jgi:hypothetical protein
MKDTNMKSRFTLFRRGEVFYAEDQDTGKQKSLKTKSADEARKIVQAKNDAVSQPLLNLVLAKTYLAAIDPKLVTRTWEDVMVRFCCRTNPVTQMRHERVIRTKPMRFLRERKLIETTADDILHALKCAAYNLGVLLRKVWGMRKPRNADEGVWGGLLAGLAWLTLAAFMVYRTITWSENRLWDIIGLVLIP